MNIVDKLPMTPVKLCVCHTALISKACWKNLKFAITARVVLRILTTKKWNIMFMRRDSWAHVEKMILNRLPEIIIIQVMRQGCVPTIQKLYKNILNSGQHSFRYRTKHTRLRPAFWCALFTPKTQYINTLLYGTTKTLLINIRKFWGAFENKLVENFRKGGQVSIDPPLWQRTVSRITRSERVLVTLWKICYRG